MVLNQIGRRCVKNELVIKIGFIRFKIACIDHFIILLFHNYFVHGLVPFTQNLFQKNCKEIVFIKRDRAVFRAIC